MNRRFTRIVVVVLAALGMVLQPSSLQSAWAKPGSPKDAFVRRMGSELWLDGRPFRFGGTNNYYLMYDSQFMVDNLLQTAQASKFNVVRMWGSLDIGNQDGSNSVDGIKNGVYFQYWDGSAPAYNDTDTGLQHLDYVIYKAKQLGIKVVIPFVNNWNAFGGIDQYVRWKGGQYHDEFYTDPVIKTWFKNWIAHLLNRTNMYTGVQYKNDPTIMTWELANEPRCKSAGAYPPSPTCNTQELTSWADEISTYIKSVDANHLVSVGDEGFYCTPGAQDWTENCGEGVDTLALTRLRNIDVMSLHLYPDGWGKDAAWGTQWIQRHIQDARRLNKADMLGEYGWLDKNTRNPVYKEWTDTVMRDGGNGALYWILSGLQDDGTYYPDYDGFTVYCPSPECITLRNFAQSIKIGFPLPFRPVADNDTVTTDFNTPVTINPAANDIAYKPAKIVTGTIDLDPLMPGKQTTFSASGGTFAVQPDNTVLFTPTADVSGKTVITYTIQDSFHRLSNPANLNVTVKPKPSAPILLASYETGTDGAGPAGGFGTVSQSTAWASDGTQSLEITVTGEGWFQVAALAAPIDVSSKTAVKLDLQTLDNQTYRNLSIKVGDGFTWCQQNGGGDGNTPSNTVATLSLDLTNMTCSGADLTKLQVVNIYLQAGTFRIDYVRAE